MNNRELENHLQDLFEGCIGPEALQSLECELRANRASWDVFRDYVHLHNGLQLRADGIDLMHVIPMDGGIERRPNPDLRKAAMFAAAAVVMMGFVAALVAIVRPRPEHMTAAGTADALWTVNGEVKKSGAEKDTVSAGSTVHVKSGTVRLLLDSGAKLTLLGPAEVSFPEIHKPVLKFGWLWIDSPEEGESFEVVTPKLLVRDIGTRFGVRVSDHGSAEVHLVGGKATVHSKSTLETITTLEPEDLGIAVSGEGQIVELPLARDPFPKLDQLLADPASYPTTVRGQNPEEYWRLDELGGRELANEIPGGNTGHSNLVLEDRDSGPGPAQGYRGFSDGNRAIRFPGSPGEPPLLFGRTPVHSGVLYRHDFSGMGLLDTAKPDVAAQGGEWAAATSPTSFGADGSFKGEGSKGSNNDIIRGGSATLPFKPVLDTVYTLDASFSELTGTNGWLAMGFAMGQSNKANRESRFLGRSVGGRAWMLLYPFESSYPSRAILGTTGSGGALASDVVWNGWSGNASDGVDLRILLDTCGSSSRWTATWLAKQRSDSNYITVRETTPLLNEDISSVGIAVSGTGISGTIEKFSLRADRKSTSGASPELPGVHSKISGEEGSVSFWFRAKPASRRQEIIWSAGNSPIDVSMYAFLSDAGQIGFFMENGRHDVRITPEEPEQSVRDGEWHHFAASWSTSSVELYLDGKLVASDSGYYGALQRSLSDVRFGGGPADFKIAPFTGLVDEIAIWNRALSRAEVFHQFQSAKGAD
jgi:hypothetical protein